MPNGTIILSENPLKSVEGCISSQARSMSEDHRDAWMYGVIFGWGDAFEEVCDKHGWSESERQRLKRLHEEWEELKSYAGDSPYEEPSECRDFNPWSDVQSVDDLCRGSKDVPAERTEPGDSTG